MLFRKGEPVFFLGLSGKGTGNFVPLIKKKFRQTRL
jgi:hypothetical protein